ncbi:MAG: hypothetical protein R3330_12535, partial [Saprospiraceae bacterium]|nr:hypothetical protein [Saprospiraceae bacterium]
DSVRNYPASCVQTPAQYIQPATNPAFCGSQRLTHGDRQLLMSETTKVGHLDTGTIPFIQIFQAVIESLTIKQIANIIHRAQGVAFLTVTYAIVIRFVATTTQGIKTAITAYGHHPGLHAAAITMVFAGVVPDLDIGFLEHVTGLITITQQVQTHAKYGAMSFLIKTSKSLTVALSDASQCAY